MSEAHISLCSRCQGTLTSLGYCYTCKSYPELHDFSFVSNKTTLPESELHDHFPDTGEDVRRKQPEPPGGREAKREMKIRPTTLKEANAFVARHHRHHKPVVGHKFSIGLEESGELIGVVIVGRPVSRHRDDGFTAEVTRLCTLGHKNACSMLYAAAWRAARAMGYERIGTYILESESGVSLIAAGWRLLYETRGDKWDRPSRRRGSHHPECKKKLFEVSQKNL